MNALKSLKLRKSLAIFVFVLLACLLMNINLFIDPIDIIDERWFVRTQHTMIDREELAKVLKKAAKMPDGTVILTTINEAWTGPGSIMNLFMESFHIGIGTGNLLKHLVIVAIDEKAFAGCKTLNGPNQCFYLPSPGSNFTTEKLYGTPDYLKLIWNRIDFLQTVLELGYNFVLTDADVMWLRNPFPHFNYQEDIIMACDYYKNDPKSRENKENGGFIFVRSSRTTIKFYKYWHRSRLWYPNQPDQQVFNRIKNGRIVMKLGVKIRYLDTAYFGGFCEIGKDMHKVCTMHANCCIGSENKTYDLTLVLEDWKNFQKLSPEKRRSRDLRSSPWRAPVKCRS